MTMKCPKAKAAVQLASVFAMQAIAPHPLLAESKAQECDLLCRQAGATMTPQGATAGIKKY
ncbi:hypothetical protein [Terrimonas alba]|uniref:hypothetical protein n=1 Tax=Terrimonas alba TaxID=3349636 RepID=UPI0035F32248